MNELNKYKIDFICLAGYMRIIPKSFLLYLEKNKYSSIPTT